MSPDRRPRRHRVKRGVLQDGHYADCVTCGHTGGLFANRDGATAQFEEHKRTGKILRDGAWS